MSEDWIEAAALADLPDGQAIEVVAGEAILALVRVGDEVHALDGMCAHQGGPLGKGTVEGCTLTCPWHGWQYDVTTGRQKLSEHIRQRRYPVRIEGDTIFVRLSDG
ncbi:MAG: Rieske 2Fe-2S domain-containing protein [Planctomycetota bacterium]